MSYKIVPTKQLKSLERKDFLIFILIWYPYTMSIFNKFKTNKKTFDEKMETLDKWEEERNGDDEKLDLWSLYTKNTKSSKTLDPTEAKFIGVNIPRRRTKPRRKIIRYDNNIYTFTYNKKNFYFDIQNIQNGAYRRPQLVKVD